MNNLKAFDPEIYDAIQKELGRQNCKLEMIASENFVSEYVLEAQGSILTNKYAEGYPGRRYHAGCEYVDIVECIAIERAKELFGAEYANVQPHSGVNANLAVYLVILKPGDTIMGMRLDHGGHLSHGSPVNISGYLYNVKFYGVDKETELIDYDEVERIALECKPKMIVAGASAYSREIDFQRFREICDKVGAYLLTDMSHISGLVAAKLLPSPVPYSDFVTTTTTKTIRGARGGIILCKEKYGKAIDKAIFPGIQGGPALQIIAAKACTFKQAMTDEFVQYAQRIIDNAKVLAKELQDRDYRIVSGGTDNHLMLVDLRSKNVTGRQAEEALDEVGISVNKNMIPYDPEKPTVTSGIRIGVSALTTRGVNAEDMKEIAELIDCTIKNINRKDEDTIEKIKERVYAICKRYPLYGYEFI